MADELENSKESGEKGDKSAGESSMGSGAAAGERLSQESFPSREESRQLSGRNSETEQSEQSASRFSQDRASDFTNQNFVRPEQQVSKSVAQNLPQLQLDTNRTAQRNLEQPVNSNIASSFEKGSKLIAEMTISHDNSANADKAVKTLDAFKSTNNSVAKLASNDSATAAMQNLERSTSLSNAVNSQDNVAQTERKSDIQNAFADKRISDSLISPDAMQKTNSMKDLAAPASKLDLASFSENQVAKSFTDKGIFENKQLIADAAFKNDAKLSKEATDITKVDISASKNETMLRVDSQTATANQSKVADLQRFQSEALRPDKSLGEFKPETKMDKSLAAEKLGSNDAMRNLDQSKPADPTRNENVRQLEKPVSDTLRNAESKSPDQPRVPETRSEASNTRSDNRQAETIKAPEQSARAADARGADETFKKPAAAVEQASPTKMEPVKAETAKQETAKPEAPKVEPAKVEAAKPEAAKQEATKQELKETTKPEHATQRSQQADRQDDNVPVAAIAAAAAAAANAAREADKANATSKPADQQSKIDGAGNSLNRATINGINAADAAIQTVKASGDKTTTPALGRDIHPSDNKGVALSAEKAANANAQDLTGKAMRIDGSIQQTSRLADQSTVNGKPETGAVSLRGEISANGRVAERNEAVAGKDISAKADTSAINSRAEAAVKGSADPRCIQFDGTVKATGDAARSEKELELQGSEAADGDSEEGDNKVKVKRYTVNGNKLYLTGVEISLAALLTMAGAARLRADKADDKQEASDGEEGKDKDSQVFIRRTYMVQEGDTLLSIAEDIYNNRHAAWLIADMNAANTKEAWIDGRRVVELQARQILELPEAEELIQFTAKQRRDFDPEKLVTVVTQNVVDRELLQAFLGTVSGQADSEASNVKGTVRATAVVPASQQLPELTIEGMEIDEQRFPPTGLGAVITDLATMIKQSLKRPTRDLGGAVS